MTNWFVKNKIKISVVLWNINLMIFLTNVVTIFLVDVELYKLRFISYRPVSDTVFLTAFNVSPNADCSSSFKENSIIFSTPLAPITVGTPMK